MIKIKGWFLKCESVSLFSNATDKIEWIDITLIEKIWDYDFETGITYFYIKGYDDKYRINSSIESVLTALEEANNA